MNLLLNARLGWVYKSASQRARVLTEDWFARNMYCPNCPSARLHPTPNNEAAVDFVCPGCGAEYQLKGTSKALGNKLRDAAYDTMIERILQNRAPNFAFLHYTPADWGVHTLLLVPGFFFSPAIIEKCPPLSASARRARWVGCNVLTGLIPEDGRIVAVDHGRAIAMSEVRDRWQRFRWLSATAPKARGWIADVLRCVRTFGPAPFHLSDVYAFAGELAAAHPDNRHIRPKIRQQLQCLRDRGVIRFLGRGRYVAIQ